MSDPIAAARAAAERYIARVNSLGDASYWPLVMLANTNLFLWHIEAFKCSGDPVPEFVEQFERATVFLEHAEASGIAGGHFENGKGGALPDSTEKFVSTMFSDVWVALSDEVYFDETHRFIVDRFARNRIDATELFRDKVVVDAGCGSGKFAAGIARLGARRVIGFDIGQRGL
ncbi:MAG: hypothetical protein ACREIP_14560, partial [Alphaproteobacteria bacterium]